MHNVIIYETDEKTYVSAIIPTVAMNMVENPGLENIAVEVEKKLKKVIDTI